MEGLPRFTNIFSRVQVQEEGEEETLVVGPPILLYLYFFFGLMGSKI
ncbi:MAG: hypothetical protein IMW96_11880 [Thermoanaerobacteraceae bacterium]|nr:hypothetical protein [Thermoanaerobacteraceae bacterium]